MEISYSEDFEEAAKIARQALPLSSQNGLPVNPINYAVFYAYYSGKNPALKQAADKLLQSGQKIQQSQLVELYQQFLATDDKQLLEGIRKELHSILNQVFSSFEEVDTYSEQYFHTMQHCIDELNEESGVDEIKNVIERIVSETQVMMASGREVQDELARATKSLNELRIEFQRAQNEALLDALTQTYNRRSFDSNLLKLTTEASERRPLCLLMIDIDHFKQINDDLGHVMGDEVLAKVAGVLRDNVRGQDIVSRYGGEEFAVLLPETATGGAIIVAETLRKKVSEIVLRRRTSREFLRAITVSIGLCEFHPKSMSPEKLLVQADKALYAAKEKGRNRVCTQLDVKDS